MMNCREATRLMSEGLDRKLTLTETAELRIHTLICSGCRNFDRQMLSLRQLMRGYARSDDDTDTQQPDSDHKPHDPR
jgi:predicted anti-sigma-YlaC factor YlaD